VILSRKRDVERLLACSSLVRYPSAAQTDDEGSNVYSTPNINWEPQETYKSGDVIEINTVVNAYQ